MYASKIADPNLPPSFGPEDSAAESWSPSAPPSPGSSPLPRRPSAKKRVHFKADKDLVEVRPITPQSPAAFPRSRSAPSFAELSPCDPRQIEQAMERARVSDFILSLGCRQVVASSGADPYYRSRPNPGSIAWPPTRPGSGSGGLPRFYAGAPTAAQLRAAPNGRPASANYTRFNFHRKPPPGPATNSRRLDVGNTSPFITVRRLSSSSAAAAAPAAGKPSGAPQRGSGRASGRGVTLGRLSDLGLGSSA